MVAGGAHTQLWNRVVGGMLGTTPNLRTGKTERQRREQQEAGGGAMEETTARCQRLGDDTTVFLSCNGPHPRSSGPRQLQEAEDSLTAPSRPGGCLLLSKQD